MLSYALTLLAFAPLPPRHACHRSAQQTTAQPVCQEQPASTQPGYISVPRGCRRARVLRAAEEAPSLSEEQVDALFREFDTSGDGFIQFEELCAALAKAGKSVSDDEARQIFDRVDANGDGQISVEEFRTVFALAPSKVPDALQALFDVPAFFLDGLGVVSDVLGIEVAGQWRNTGRGQRYVDDVIGDGKLLLPGDVAMLHYSLTLLDSGRTVENTRLRDGRPLGFQIGSEESAGNKVEGWSDAVAGMRVGGQRRVYAKPIEGDGPTARYDIEIVACEEGSDPSPVEKALATVGGRRGAVRLLFAASFLPYLLPSEERPAIYTPMASDEAAAEGRDSDKFDAMFDSGSKPRPAQQSAWDLLDALPAKNK